MGAIAAVRDSSRSVTIMFEEDLFFHNGDNFDIAHA